jgi:S-(hydroxymethyl)glutathione dehydrogenase/alcohol dehydrogenase
VAAGELDLRSLVTAETDLDGINDAFDQMKAGHGARTLVRMNVGA